MLAVRILVFISALILFQSIYAAGESAQGVTLDGRLYDNSFTGPLLDSSVSFKIQVLDPSKTCVLYEETQVQDLNASNGYFNISVGSATGAGKRSAGDSNNAMLDIFQNVSAITGTNATPSTCTGSSYTPSSGDERFIRVEITPSGTGTPEVLSPDMTLNSVSNALVCESVQGLDRTKLAEFGTHINANMTAANLLVLFDGSDASSLHSHDGDYARIDGTNSFTGNISMSNQTNLQVGDYTNAEEATLVGTLLGSDAGRMWYNSDTNQLKYWDGSTTQTIDIGGSALTSFNGETGSTQTLATPGTSGTAPNWVSATNAHTLNIPMANTASVTAGLISKTEYDAFNAKVDRSGDTMTGSLVVDGSADAIQLTVEGNGTQTTNLVEFQQSTSTVIASIRGDGVPTATTDLTTKSYVDGAITTAAGSYILEDGSNALTGNWDVGDFDITNIDDLDADTLAVSGASTLTGDLTVDTNVLHVDTTADRIGLGVLTPSYVLSIEGNSAKSIGMERHTTADTAGNDLTLLAGGATSAATDKDGGDLYLQSGTATGTGSSSIYFQTATAQGSTNTTDNAVSTKMTILGNGNVGIGTTSPTSPLHILNSGPYNALLLEKSGSGAYVPLSIKGSGNTNDHGVGINLENSSNVSQVLLRSANESGSTNVSSFVIETNNGAGVTEKFRVTGAGNVGIGTTSPTSTLEVNGVIRTTASISNGTTTIDFATGNLQYTSSDCNTFDLHNLKDGGTYSFAVQGTTSALCVFNAYSDAGTTSLTVHLPAGHQATTNGEHTVYAIMVMGTHAYFSWITEFD